MKKLFCRHYPFFKAAVAALSCLGEALSLRFFLSGLSVVPFIYYNNGAQYPAMGTVIPMGVVCCRAGAFAAECPRI
ncbi:MAG: hypothetical protein HY796_01885 [Elusimicrobia bacterium]|nr:hypothetical protein [Elusimicrobiota bacterium]